ncbi:MAG: methyltransferase domain-containing protein [Opitutaceae bacterium]|nr:methyltransferase domain-containing protein [Verrucomicrobiales bacterium]
MVSVSKSMFFSARSTQAEYFDAPTRSFQEVCDGYRHLGQVNRFFHFAEPFQRLIPRFLGAVRCQNLTLLDLGAGDGTLGRELSLWAEKRGWQWRFTSLDLNPQALSLNRHHANVAASVTDLPFKDGSFDLVIASQMTHHLDSDTDICRHFAEAWRVARQAVFLNDLHRNPALFGFIWILLHMRPYPRHFREDGLISVKRGFRVGEWRDLARLAGMKKARVWFYFGAKVMLYAPKDSAATPGS